MAMSEPRIIDRQPISIRPRVKEMQVIVLRCLELVLNVAPLGWFDFTGEVNGVAR